MSVCLTKKPMRENLTEPTMREYTPEHIAVESAPPKPLPSYTPKHIRPEVMPEDEPRKASIDVSVVKVENAPAVEVKNAPVVVDTQLDMCMTTVLDSFDSANEDTEDCLKDFYKRFRSKRRELRKRRRQEKWENRRHLGGCARLALISFGLSAMFMLMGLVVVPYMGNSIIADCSGTPDADSITASVTYFVSTMRRFSLLAGFSTSLLGDFSLVKGIIQGDLLE